MKTRGLYIHIPFCMRKCLYCDFYSVTGKTELMGQFVSAVLTEAKTYAGDRIDTIYLGGGTPSLLGPDHLPTLMSELAKVFNLSGLSEATIEVNPDTATPDFYETARRCCFNRISVGVQSLSDAELHQSGRLHNSNQALQTLQQARNAGFTNVSADIIIGLPGQTWKSLENTIERLLATGINHISAYCLSVEEGAPFAVNRPDSLPDDNLQANLYKKTIRCLKHHGFIHYEISNFCEPGMECLHNLNYWRSGDYIGLGPAAASHINGFRYSNVADLQKYLAEPAGVRSEIECLATPDKLGEEAMLRLRLLCEGFDLADIQRKYATEAEGLSQRLGMLVGNRSLFKRGSRYFVPSSRVLTCNTILADVLS